MAEYEIKIDNRTYNISSDHNLSDAELSEAVKQFIGGNAAKPRSRGQSSNWQVLTEFAKSQGFTVTGKNETSGHNPGSMHYQGRAIDIRTRDKSPQQVAAIIDRAKSLGISVFDERVKPNKPGYVWSGPHVHLSLQDANVGKVREFLNPKKPVVSNDTDLGKAINRIFSPAPVTKEKPRGKGFYDVIQSATGIDVAGGIQRDLDENPGKTLSHIRQGEQGTLENAMQTVDQRIGSRLSPENRKTIRGYLSSIYDERAITPQDLQQVFQIAGRGAYGILKPASEIVSDLPFTIGDLLGRYHSKDPAALIPTRAGGNVTLSAAKGIVAKKLGIKPEEVTTKLLAALAKGSAPELGHIDEEEKLNPVEALLVNAIGGKDTSNAATFLKAPGAAFAVFPQMLQEAAGQALGLKRGQTLEDEGIQAHPVGRFGSVLFQIGKYFAPGGQAAIGSDLSHVIGRATEVGPVKATAEAAEGLFESANVFAPGLDTAERVARGLNAVLLGYGLSKGAINAYKTGQKALAAKELGEKLGVSRFEAFKILRDAETHASEYIARQVALGKDTIAARYFADVSDAYDQAQEARQPIGSTFPSERNAPLPAHMVGEFTPSADGRLAAITVADPRAGEARQLKHEMDRKLAAGEITAEQHRAALKEVDKPGEEGELLYVELNPEQQRAYDQANEKYRQDLSFLRALERDGELSKEAALREKQKLILDLHRQHREISGHTLEGENPRFDQSPVVASEKAGAGHSRADVVPFNENTLVGRGRYYDVKEGNGPFKYADVKLPDNLPKYEDYRRRVQSYIDSVKSPSSGIPLTDAQVAESVNKIKGKVTGSWWENHRAAVNEAADSAAKRLKENKYDQPLGSLLGGIDPQKLSDLVVVTYRYLLETAGSVAETSKRLMGEHNLDKRQARELINRAIEGKVSDTVRDIIKQSSGKAEAQKRIREALGKLGEGNIGRLYKAGLKQVQETFYPTHLVGTQKAQAVDQGNGFRSLRTKNWTEIGRETIVRKKTGTREDGKPEYEETRHYTDPAGKPISDVINIDKISDDDLRLQVRTETSGYVDTIERYRALGSSGSSLDSERVRREAEKIQSRVAKLIEQGTGMDSPDAAQLAKREILKAFVDNSPEHTLDFIVDSADTVLTHSDLESIRIKIAESKDRERSIDDHLHDGQVDWLTHDELLGENRDRLIDDLMPFVIKGQKQGVADTLISLWKVGLITTFRNPVVNLKGNTLTSLGLTLSRGPRAAVDAGLSLFSGERTRLGWINGIDALLKNARIKTATDTAKLMKGAFKGELTEADSIKLDQASKWNSGSPKANWIIDHGFGLVQAWDKPFYVVAYKRSLEEQAHLLAKNQGLTGESYAKAVSRLRESPTTEMQWNAQGDAEYAILASKNYIADSIRGAKQHLRRTGPTGEAFAQLGEVIMPFQTIPMNVARMGAEWAGGGVVSGLFKLGKLSLRERESGRAITWGQAIRNALRDRPSEQRAISDSIGNGLTGLGIMALGAYIYDKNPDAITPYRPNDANAHSELEAMGRKEASAKIFGYDVDLTESAVGRLFAAGATVAAYVNGDLDQGGKHPGKFHTVMGVVGPGLLESPLSGSTTLLSDALQGDDRAVERWLQSTAGSVVPGALNELGLWQDPDTKVIETGVAGIGDRLLSRLPFAKSGLQLKTDVLGQVTDRTFIEQVTGSSRATDNPVALEMKRLRIPFSRPARQAASQDKWTKSGEDQRNDRNDADYQERIAFVGTRVQQAASKLLSKQSYQSKSDEGKAAYMKAVISSQRKRANQELNYMRIKQGREETRRIVYEEVLKNQHAGI